MKIKTRRYYFYYLLRAGAFVLWIVPIRLASRLGHIVGGLAYLLSGRYRKTTVDNLKAVFPDKTSEDISGIGRRTFSNIFANFAELSQTAKLSRENIHLWVTPYGMEKFEDVFARGKGLIVLTAHFGNWELVGSYILMRGYSGTTIVRKLYFHKYDRYLANLRGVHRMEPVYRDDSPRKMLEYLKRNQILGMLADQDINSVEGVFVDFFGKPAYTPAAPVKIAMASGAPLVPCFMLRDPDKPGKYRFIVEDPIYVERPPGRKDEAVMKYTQVWTKVLESYIMKYPDQWVWMHKRWKTRQEETAK